MDNKPPKDFQDILKAIKIAKAVLGKIKVSRETPPQLKRDYKVKAGTKGGTIMAYGLTDWWLSTFTDEERDYIEKRNEQDQFMQIYPGKVSLTKGAGGY